MKTRRDVIFVTVILLFTAAFATGGIAALRLAERRRAEAAVSASPQNAISVGVAMAAECSASFEVRTHGFLSPFESATLASQVTGFVESLYVEYSEEVTADSALVQLDRGLRESALRRTQAAHERAAAELELARENIRRIEKLEQSESTNPTEIIHFNTALEVAVAVERESAAAVREATILLEETIIRSPFDGVVARVYIRRGEFTGIGQPLVDVIDINRLKLVVQLDERQVVSFAAGDPVHLTCGARPGEEFHGTILRIAPRATLDSRKFEVEIEVPNADRRLRPGFYADARLSGRDQVFNADQENRGRPVCVPRTAVLEQFSQHFCYLVVGETGGSSGRAVRKLVSVVPLQSDPQSVHVTGDLTVGDRVITTGIQHVTEGADVRIVD